MDVSQLGALGTQGQQNPTGKNAFADVDLDDFLKLLITELRNQDPLNPMDNQEILDQVSQIREIESNNRLTETLDTVLLGQNMATAGSLIDRVISGIDAKGTSVNGRVDRVSVTDGKPKLHVGDLTVELTNVSGIAAE